MAPSSVRRKNTQLRRPYPDSRADSTHPCPHSASHVRRLYLRALSSHWHHRHRRSFIRLPIFFVPISQTRSRLRSLKNVGNEERAIRSVYVMRIGLAVNEAEAEKNIKEGGRPRHEEGQGGCGHGRMGTGYVIVS